MGINVVSLFSGGGGLDLGFVAEGYNVIWAIDIINTLSKHYGIAAPLFFDNLDALDSENQRRVFDTASGEIQKITLTVSDDTELTIEGDKE